MWNGSKRNLRKMQCSISERCAHKRRRFNSSDFCVPERRQLREDQVPYVLRRRHGLLSQLEVLHSSQLRVHFVLC